MARLLLLLGIAPLLAFGPAKALADDRERVFAWFDQLGYTPLLKGSLVEVDRWKWRDEFGKHGLTRELGFEVAPNTPNAAFLSLALYADRAFWLEQTVPRRDIPIGPDTFGAHLDQELADFRVDDPVALLCLSRSFDLAGKRLTSEELFARCQRRLPTGLTSAAEVAALEARIAACLAGEFSVNLQDPHLSGRVLRTQAAAIVEHSPGAGGGLARELLPMLELMANEEAAHGKVGDIGHLPLEKRVEELIFQLRDEQETVMFPDEVLVSTFASKGRRPCQRLLEIGFPAVPKLIACLDDARPTRTYATGMGMHARGSGLRIRDFALQILKVIAVRDLSPGIGGATLTDESARKTKENATAWWQEVQTKGQLGMMVDEVREAKSDVPLVARRLATLYPDHAFEPIVYAIEHVKDAINRPYLILSLARTHDPAVPAYARKLMAGDDSLLERLAAARVLAATDADTAIGFIVPLLRKIPPFPATFVYELGRPEMVEYLVHSQRPKALQLLASGEAAIDPSEVFGDLVELSLGWVNPFDQDLPKIAKPDVVTREAFWHEAERYLANVLGKPSPLEFSGQIHGREVKGLTAAEVAAMALAAHWPNRYRFDAEGPKTARDRQRIICLNAWRKLNGQSPLAVPDAEPREKADAKLDRVVTRVKVVTSDVAPRVWMSRVQGLKGKKLTAHDIFSLIGDLIAAFPPGCERFKLSARKYASSNGVELTVEFDGPTADPLSRGGWSFDHDFSVDGESAGSGTLSGGMTTVEFRDEAFSEIANGLDQTFLRRSRGTFRFDIAIGHLP